MFFKMFYNDLKKNKGLNVILFVFVIVSFILSVAGVMQVYIHSHGVEYSMEQCKSSDMMALYAFPQSSKEEQIEEISNWLDQREDVVEHSFIEAINLDTTYISLVDSEVDVESTLCNGYKIITTQTTDMDLLYNTNNEPFYVENGTIALPVDVREWADLKIGDKIRLTTQIGYVYEFTISHFYKEPSSMNIYRFILSQEDYALFATECPYRLDICKVRLKEGVEVNDFAGMFPFEKTEGFLFRAIAILGISLTHTVSILVSYFLMIINVFVVLIMLLMIRFMLLSTLKEEEKEVGMMRAIGVDGFSYRFLFVAKYVGFAVIGAVVGIIVGMILSKVQVDLFCQNTMFPSFSTRLSLAILAVCGMALGMIIFTMLVMRRVNRISVMDAIHGENRGERFGKLSKFVLHKRKKISVPSYLAVSDLLNSSKKYMILIITYSLGAMIILSLFYLRTTLVSEEYFRSFLELKTDFYIAQDAKIFETYYLQEGGMEGAIKTFNKDFKEAGIPAEINYDYVCYGKILTKESKNDISCSMFFGDVDKEEFPFRAEGTVPKLANEVAISYKTAQLNGLEIGDTITIEYDIYGGNRTETKETSGEFIITGYIDCMEAGLGTVILMGEEEPNAVRDEIHALTFRIHGTEKEKETYLMQMKELYEEEVILSHEENAERNMSYVIAPLDILKIVMTMVVLGVIVLMTILYSSVLLHGENNSVAMLKCLGFEEKDIKKWHMIRIMIITAIACILGNVIAQTVIEWITGYVYDQNFGCSGFGFTINPLESYILVPAMIMATVFMTMCFVLKKVSRIQIWEIRED